MNWTTVPGIEYEVFLAACPYPCWKPKYPPSPQAYMVGSNLSTLSVFPNMEGVAEFYSHDALEMGYFMRGIEEHFGVEVVEIEGV